MKKILGIIVALCVLCVPNLKAEEVDFDNMELLSKTTKYYKTTTYLNPIEYAQYNDVYNNNSITEEITEEEYNAAPTDVQPAAAIETSYRRTESFIYYSDSKHYTYKVDNTWKTMPTMRSYDIIGIGYNPSVIIDGTPVFRQDYCLKTGQCTSSSSYDPQTFYGGAGASFKIPTQDLSSISQTLYFYVKKNTDATIISQRCAGDYAAAATNISYSQSRKYTVDVAGIDLDASIFNYYNTASPAVTSWSGSW